MIIVLDYDDTFTRDPELWYAFSKMLWARGHSVIGCTMRSKAEKFDINPLYYESCEMVYYSNRKGKRSYLASLRIFPHVWIDDNPEFVCFDASS